MTSEKRPMCGDCHVQPAKWFAHPPDECDDADCDCEPQCQDCIEYLMYLHDIIGLTKN